MTEESEGETRQLTLTVREETLQELERLYPHLLKPQHRLLAAVTEVQRTRAAQYEEATGNPHATLRDP
jgi:hypothetical protein